MYSSAMRRLATAAVAGTLFTSLVACGTADSDDVAGPAKADSAEAQACVDTVTPIVAAGTATPDLIAPTAPLDLASLAGGTIWYITVSMNQFSADTLEGVEAAAQAAGVKVKSYDGQGNTNRFTEGIEQAVAQKAAGIILLGIDPAVVSSALKSAKAAGIPVQNMLNGDPGDPLAEGLYGNLTSNFSADGELAAAWSLADSACNTHLAIVYSNSVGVWRMAAEAAEAKVASACPACEVTMVDVDLANVATDVGSKLQSALQKDPGINYVFAPWDSAVTYITPVLAAANSKAKIVSRDGLEANVGWVKDGTQAMTLGMPPTQWLGWLAMDDVLRAVSGQEAPGYVIPSRVIDSTTVGDGSAAAMWPSYVDYADAFVQAWKG